MCTVFFSDFLILSKRGALFISMSEGIWTVFAPSGNSRNSTDRIFDSFMHFFGNCLNENKQVRGRGGLFVCTVCVFGDFTVLVGNLSYKSTVLSDSSPDSVFGLSASVLSSCEDMLKTTVSESLD